MTEHLGADVILRNALVITVDEDFTVAGAVAVRGGRILAVGADADIDALAGVAPDNPVYIRPIWGFWRHTLPLVPIHRRGV